MIRKLFRSDLLENCGFLFILSLPFLILAELTFVFWGTWFRYAMFTIDIAVMTIFLLVVILGFFVRHGLNGPPPWDPEYERRYPGQAEQIAKHIAAFIKEKSKHHESTS